MSDWLPVNSEKKLVRLLQNAYSGERAAAYAYRGHAASVSNLQEKTEIINIEKEEWEHRACIKEMLFTLGSKPRISRELLMGFIGCVIYCFCRVGGWFNLFNFGWYMSMYGAGKLEQSNINEYDVAARKAIQCNRQIFVADLIHMAEIEWDHENYFRSKVLESRWSKIIKPWTFPASRESTRKNIEHLKS